MSQHTQKNLLQKYNVPGPRYTSYPTVPYWEGVPTTKQWLESLRKHYNSKRGLALYVHIPFCRQLCTYCGCNTRISRNREVGLRYVKTVLKEWTYYLNEFSQPSISDLHLGGGTPTFLTSIELELLITGILKHSIVAGDSEFALEADPRVTTAEQLEVLYHLGFRRLSLGIQDFDPKVQEIVNRVQTFEQVQTIVETSRKLGYSSINFDLIYGLPFQTLKSVEGTIKKVCQLMPERIAFYAYAHVPWIKPSQRRFTEKDLPQGIEKRKLYELGRELLEKAGYVEIGMDHFALKKDSLFQAAEDRHLHRNFMGYVAKEAFPLIGLGVSAIGDAWEVYVQNEKRLERYTERVEAGELPVLRGHCLSNEDQILRRHILNLMTRFETEWSSEGTQTPHLEGISQKLAPVSEDGLIQLHPQSCSLTPKGRPFLRNICMAFDARLQRKFPETQLFSQTI